MDTSPQNIPTDTNEKLCSLKSAWIFPTPKKLNPLLKIKFDCAFVLYSAELIKGYKESIN
ncbi:hypothetical protein HpDR126_14530 [Helicobacter pylori]|uniref:Uncharacterized protein n=1 Tax=Helicobacter pylori TaxID=210 RepID=A0A2A6VW93_HELPX|nr:hypothetical protein BB380_04700 [Helicobacter pylori]PDW96147.1 hypothetical protein BB398_03510 [Helicobacter pylori]PDX18756.1 hypothetical protein BB413_00175 [Helicobacter pylori]